MKDKPEMEQKLFYWQDKFYETDDENNKFAAWTEMFNLVKIYSKSLILQKLKNKKYQDPDIVEEKSVQCALIYMSQYLDKPGFRACASFAGMINPKVLEVLYKPQRDEKHESLNKAISDSETELGDMSERFHYEQIFCDNTVFEPESILYKKSLKQTLNRLLGEFDESVQSEHYRFLIRMYLYLLLKKPKNKHIKACFKKTWCKDFKMKQLLELFQLELRERLENND
jgi:hypothetical protein